MAKFPAVTHRSRRTITCSTRTVAASNTQTMGMVLCKSKDALQRLMKKRTSYFIRSAHQGSTQSRSTYKLWKEEETKENTIEGTPTSITWSTPTKMVKLSEGLPLAIDKQEPGHFLAFLAKWGGEWMWEGLDKNQTTYNTLTWRVEGM